MARILAFYLPQFHPIPENDEWYGKGFTEWTNVAKARPLFRGHYQPHIPADLGFYDLRFSHTIHSQAKLAREYGIEGFCYWHYWFGNGKRLLEKPFIDLVNDKTVDISFSLAWANESWQKKLWDSKQQNQTIAEQLYPGSNDYKKHFYEMLPAFKDKRYTRVDGKLFFVIYRPLASEEIANFINVWRELAKKEGIGEFYFVGRDAACRDKQKILSLGFDAIYDDNGLNIHHDLSLSNKIRLKIERDYLHRPTVFQYKDAIKHMIIKQDEEDDVIPLVLPNWDHSPRSGKKSIIYDNAEPKYFKEVLRDAMECVERRSPEKQIILVRAWNEWGEGNHLEPDLRYGRGYLEVIKSINQGDK